MSNQEAMFSPQENRPREQNNTDPREQPYQQQPWREEAPNTTGQHTYETGYGGTRPASGWMSEEGEKLRPPLPDQSAPWKWITGALVVLALAAVFWVLINLILGFIFLLLGLVVALLAINQLVVRKIIAPPHVFQMEGQPTLVIHNPAGSLRIHSSKGNSIEILATKYVTGLFGDLAEGPMDYCTRDGNTIRVATESSYHRWSLLGGLRGVTFDITVPPHCDIQLQGDAGTIQIAGVSGQIQAQTKAGTIDVQQATLKGQSHLITSAGTINVKQATLEGQSDLTTSAGTIDLRQATLKGQVNVHTNAGTIYFQGTLDPQGTYRMETNMGTVDAIIPSDTSLTLTASTAMGTITNEFGGTLVGPAPHANLELRTNLGTITVRKSKR